MVSGFQAADRSTTVSKVRLVELLNKQVQT